MGGPVNTLHVVEYLELGGIERLLEQLARHTPRDKARLHFFSYETGTVTGIGKDLEALGVPLYTYKKKNGYDAEVLARLARVVRERDIRVVHTHDFGPMEYAARLKLRFPRLRLVHTHHTLPHFVSNRKYTLFFQLVSHLYHRIVCVSESLREELRSHCPLATRRMVVIPNGIAADVFSPSTRRADGVLRMVSVGRIAPQKNLPYLLRTCALLDEAGVPFELHHAGAGDAELERELRAFIAAHGLSDRVHLHGFQADVRPILAKGDVFAFSSVWEGHPVALLEAMASGKACVVSDIPAHRQFGSRAARYFSLDDERALFDELLALRRDPAEIDRLGRAAREQSAAQFGLGRMIDSYGELYV